MKRLIVIIGLLLATACVTASDGAKYVLDNYLIPVKQPGAMIGRICPAPAEAEIVQDTASFFRLDAKMGTLSLKKGKAVTDDPASFRYGITLALDGQLCEFELTPGLTAEVLRLSNGRMREVLNILANIERIAATNGLTGPLDVPQFAGVTLTHDWQSRTAKSVRA